MYDSNDWMASLHREVGGGVRMGPHTQGYAVTLLLPCSVCHQNKEFSTKDKLPPPVYAKKLRTKGWHIGKHLVCPSCVKTRPNAVRTPQPIPQPAPVIKVQDLSSLDQLFASPPQEEKRPSTKAELLGSLSSLFSGTAKSPPVEPVKTPATPAAQLPLPAAKPALPTAPKKIAKNTPKAPAPKQAPKQAPASEELSPPPAESVQAVGLTQVQRSAVMLALEAHFRTESGTWSGDYNDAKIAVESKVPVQEVVALRREWFGELRQSPELTAAREAYELYRAETRRFVVTAKAELAERKENLRKLLSVVSSLEN